MEKHYAVQPTGVQYICDTCREGEMLPTGQNNWSTDPPEFEHSCNQCGTKNTLKEKYPLIRYQSIW